MTTKGILIQWESESFQEGGEILTDPNLHSAIVVPLDPQLVPQRGDDQRFTDLGDGEKIRLTLQLLCLLAGVGVLIHCHLICSSHLGHFCNFTHL